jgi:hypothetical protein
MEKFKYLWKTFTSQNFIDEKLSAEQNKEFMKYHWTI